jgi:type I restriction enzyme S subunit
LAELLWAADEVVEREKEVICQLDAEYTISVQSLMEESHLRKQLSEVTHINHSALSQKTPSNCIIKYIDIASIVRPKVLGEVKEYSFENAPSRARRIVKKNDIIVSMVRPYLKSFVQIRDENSNLIASTGTAVISPKEGVFIDYIFHSLFSNEFMAHCESRMNGTNYPAITPKDLGEFQIPVPDINAQKSIANKLNAIDDMKKRYEEQINLTKGLKSELINQIF